MKQYDSLLLEQIVNVFAALPLSEALTSLGTFDADLPTGAARYKSLRPEFKHFIVYRVGEDYELCFLLSDGVIAYSDIERRFSKLSITYNFRDNYTRFDCPAGRGAVRGVFFTKDNKVERSDDSFIEKSPFGSRVVSQDLMFEGFCLVRGGR